ncbi:tail fiber domain-containing protein [Phenylobacterium sp.]|uniref:tail fiber domain-containing protein n=1 Tax=Phenylobacterium sp. TaxID=1871053 RepID=UPI000C8B77C7|nr:tail fiber domain-containing protein [Phenylobacterium sp.]MAK82580.1 hypothetical protein [Phenylobacterium sp.]
MAKLLKLRGGTTSQHSSFTGAEREVTVDTDKETLVVHNGSQAGGFPLARADGSGTSNFTITGELDCATLDVSGDADIDGTLEADAITIGGTAIASVLSPVAGSSSIVTTGALDSGSITSGFGNIDVGSSSVTANGGVVVDNITIDGTEIDLSSGDLTLDVEGDIILDAKGQQIYFKKDGTTFGQVQTEASPSSFSFESTVSDGDIIFKGNDGGSSITALTIDMSEAGSATFNNNVTAFSDERLKSNIETIDGGLAKILSMRGVTYTKDDKDNVGVIAQEVEKVIPQIVMTADDEMGTKSVDYSRITAVLIEAVKELTKRVEELENK